MRRVFLWAARNRWLKERLPRLPFMRRAVRRFMPGETLEDALAAALPLQAAGIGTMYTRLGENLEDLAEAEEVAAHYLEAIDKIVAAGITGEISVKPTQLGLDHDADVCLAHLVRIAEHAAAAGSYLWIDMEGSAYAESTIALYERLRAVQPRTGICLQAYLRRTAADIERLRPLDPAIRLVKGAYDEKAAIAYTRPPRRRCELRRARGPVPPGRPRTADPARARDARRGAHRADRRAGRAGRHRARRRSRSRCSTASGPTSSSVWRKRATASRRSSPTVKSGIRGTCGDSRSGRRTSGSPSVRCCREFGGLDASRRPDGHHRHGERLRSLGARSRAGGTGPVDRPPPDRRAGLRHAGQRPRGGQAGARRRLDALPAVRRDPGPARGDRRRRLGPQGLPGRAVPGVRHARRQGRDVLRDPRPGRPGRRGPLPGPGLPDLRVDDAVRRRDAGADPDPPGERLPPRPRRARVAHHAADPAPRHQLAGQPDRRGPHPRRPRADRRRWRIEHDLWVLADEIYGRIVYDGEHVSHRLAARHGRADDRARRVLQDLRDDRLADGLRDRPGVARGDRTAS